MSPSTPSISSLGEEIDDLNESSHVSSLGPYSTEAATRNGQIELGNGQPTVVSERLLQHDHSKHSSHGVSELANEPENLKGFRRHTHLDTKQTSWYHDWWLWQIIAIGVSVGATVAIITILAKYNGRPLPNWPYSITLNSMISVLSTISKTTMVFAATECIGQAKCLLFQQGAHSLMDLSTIDEASRGPEIGVAACLLAFCMKGRAILASIGALVFVTSLAVDPFVQQVLNYPQRSVVTDKFVAPSLPSVSRWNASGSGTLFMSERADPTSALPLSMRAAIYQSIFSLGAANSTLNINCPVDNCTFAPTDTLGFCSKCSDVTPKVDSKCTSRRTPSKGRDRNCSYHLPDGLTVHAKSENSTFTFADFVETTNMSMKTLDRYAALRSADLSMTPSSRVVTDGPFEPDTTIFQNITSPLLGFGRIALNKSFDPLPVINGEVKPRATECALYWCIQTVNASVRNGVLTQKVTNKYFNASAKDTPEAYLQPLHSGRNKPRNYFVITLAQLPLAAFLEKTFTGNASFWSLPNVGLSQEEIDELTQYSSDVVQALWNLEDLNGLMDNMANRLTDALRNQFQDPAFSERGEVLTTEVHVSVQWLWLILPVALVLISCGLLLASIISSSGKAKVVWKNSVLSVLFHGLNVPDAGIGEGAGRAIGKNQMEEEAEGLQVRLENSDDGGFCLMDAGPIVQSRRDPARTRFRRWNWREKA